MKRKFALPTLYLIAMLNAGATIYILIAREPSNINYVSLIVSTLGVLLTFAVAWQIYNAFYLRDIKSQIDNIRQQAREDVAIAKARLSAQMAINEDSQANNDIALTLYLQSLDVYCNEVADKDRMANYMREIADSLSDFIRRVKPSSISYYPDTRDDMIRISLQLRKANIYNIVDYVKLTGILK